MHSELSKPRPSGHLDSLAARKYPKILVTIRSIVCYSIPSKGEHRATPERREHAMTTQTTDIKAIRKRWNQLRKDSGPYCNWKTGLRFETWTFSNARNSATVQVYIEDFEKFMALEPVKSFVADTECKVEHEVHGIYDNKYIVRFVF